MFQVQAISFLTESKMQTEITKTLLCLISVYVSFLLTVILSGDNQGHPHWSGLWSRGCPKSFTLWFHLAWVGHASHEATIAHSSDSAEAPISITISLVFLLSQLDHHLQNMESLHFYIYMCVIYIWIIPILIYMCVCYIWVNWVYNSISYICLYVD